MRSPSIRTAAGLASAGNDHTIKLWDTATGREVASLRGHSSPVLAVSYRPDGHVLASGGEDGTIRIWDTATGRELRVLLDISRRSGAWRTARTATALPRGQDKTVGLWDADTGRLVRTLGGHSAIVWAVAYSPDGRTIASAGAPPTGP